MLHISSLISPCSSFHQNNTAKWNFRTGASGGRGETEHTYNTIKLSLSSYSTNPSWSRIRGITLILRKREGRRSFRSSDGTGRRSRSVQTPCSTNRYGREVSSTRSSDTVS